MNNKPSVSVSVSLSHQFDPIIMFMIEIMYVCIHELKNGSNIFKLFYLKSTGNKCCIIKNVKNYQYDKLLVKWFYRKKYSLLNEE